MGELELASDDMARNTQDPKGRLAALTFKMNAVPQMQLALFQRDPVAALVDTWALLVQLDNRTVELMQKQTPLTPEQLSLARARFLQMEGEVEALWRTITGQPDISAAQATVEKWAKENPLDDTLVTRKSTAALLSSLTSSGGLNLAGAAGQLVEDTHDLTTRIDLLSGTLPKSARWQAEYMLRDSLMDPTLLKSTGVDMAGLVRSVDQVGGAVSDLPQLLSSERRAVLADIDRQRGLTQQFIDEQRQAVSADLRAERLAATQDLDRMTDAWIDRSFDRATALMDRLMLRLVLAAVILGLALMVATLLVIRALRPHGEVPGPGRRVPSHPAEV
jgi:hypothetical protein